MVALVKIAAVLLPGACALVNPQPRQTNDFDAPATRARNGVSPNPTNAPRAVDVLARLEKRALGNTCGYWSTRTLTCDAGEYCAFDTTKTLADCCPVDSSGSFTSCYFNSVCFNGPQKTSICGASDCDYGTVWCTKTDFPSCVTYDLTGTVAGVAGSYQTYRCGSNFITREGSIESTSAAVINSLSESASSEDTGMPVTETTSTPTSTGTAIGTNGSSTPQPSSKKSNTGAIAGGVVGGIVGLALIVGAVVFIMWRIKTKKAEAYAEDVPEMSGNVNPK